MDTFLQKYIRILLAVDSTEAFECNTLKQTKLTGNLESEETLDSWLE